MGKAKKERGKQRLEELIRLAEIEGYRVQIFSPIHIRVYGDSSVDYWPTTAKAWRVGSSAAMPHVGPSDVIAMAKVGQHVVEQAAAISHMRAIVNDEGPPPWE